ncbi:transposable element Tcb1 transposase [Trichonephila clavipes]|nr:transposable element Tcb1 transposase [Trichonephila clavipes]
MAVTDRSVTSQTIAQHIESVTHHSVSAGTIRRRLHQGGLSARRPWLGLPLTQNHRRLRRQWTVIWNVVLNLNGPQSLAVEKTAAWTLGSETMAAASLDAALDRFCSQHQDGRIRVWRHRSEHTLLVCIHHCHTGPSSSLLQDNAQPHVVCIVWTFLDTENVRLLPSSERSSDLSPIENVWSMVTERLALHHTLVTTVD